METIDKLLMPKTRLDETGLYRWTQGSKAAKIRLLASLAAESPALAVGKPVPKLIQIAADKRKRNLALARAKKRFLADMGRD